MISNHSVVVPVTRYDHNVTVATIVPVYYRFLDRFRQLNVIYFAVCACWSVLSEVLCRCVCVSYDQCASHEKEGVMWGGAFPVVLIKLSWPRHC